MVVPNEPAIAAHIGDFADRCADPSGQVWRLLTADLATSTGLHPTAILPMIRGFAAGYGRRRCQKALRRVLSGGSSQPVGTVAVVAPSNVPVAAWQAVIEPLLAGNAVRVRPSTRDGVALPNFVAALRAVAPAVAERITLWSLPHSDPDGWQPFLDGVGCLAIHGSDAAATAILGHAAAAGYAGRVRIHGSRRSLAVVDAATWHRAPQVWAQRLARDALAVDGRGCMSLGTVIWLGLDTDGLAQAHALLAAAIAQQAVRWPPGSRDVAVSAPLTYLGETLAVEAACARGAMWFSGRDDGWLATAADVAALGEAWPGPAHRCVVATAGSSVDAVLACCARGGPWSSLAWAGPAALGASIQRALGVPRRCAVGSLQSPRADRAADGFRPGEGMRIWLGP